MNRSLLIILIIAAVGAVAASKSAFSFQFNSCIKGEGEPVDRTLAPGNFTGIETHLSAELELVQDSICSVDLHGQANLLDKVTLKIENNVLIIGTDAHCLDSDGKMHITVRLPKLEYLACHGSGDVLGNGRFTDENEFRMELHGSSDVRLQMEAQKIFLEANGSSTVQLAGNAQETHVDINGSGEVQAFDLQTHRAFLEINGSGDIEIFADSLLDVSLNGSGNVVYKGNPGSLRTDVHGSGNVEKR